MVTEAYDPLTGKLEELEDEEVEILHELRKQFLKDSEILIAEREIVKEILDQHLSKIKGCTD